MGSPSLASSSVEVSTAWAKRWKSLNTATPTSLAWFSSSGSWTRVSREPADVVVADLLRAGQRPGIAPEIGQALDQLLLHDGFVGGAGFRRAVGGRAGHLDIPVE
jgi:hypothetical protein